MNYVPMPGVAGTSCASPTFSGIVSLLNDIRLSKGLSTLGFLNPFLVCSARAGLDADMRCSTNTRRS